METTQVPRSSMPTLSGKWLHQHTRLQLELQNQGWIMAFLDNHCRFNSAWQEACDSPAQAEHTNQLGFWIGYGARRAWDRTKGPALKATKRVWITARYQGSSIKLGKAVLWLSARRAAGTLGFRVWTWATSSSSPRCPWVHNTGHAEVRHTYISPQLIRTSSTIGAQVLGWDKDAVPCPGHPFPFPL